jgi:FHA domain
MRDDAKVARKLNRHESATMRVRLRVVNRHAYASFVHSTHSIKIDGMPRLIISGIAHELMDEAITIGRGPDNAIVINDPSASTHHARLVLEGDTYRLKDLDSTNGTLVNGTLVTETVLRFDDRIRFGSAEAWYERDTPGLKPPPQPEEIRAQFAADTAPQPHFTGASPFRRQEPQNDPVRTGILVSLAIVLLLFLGSMIAVLMMHAPSL